MTITVNGERREILRAKNVCDLLGEMQLSPHALLVEQNGIALRPTEWGAELRDGDCVEIIRIVAGG